MGECSPHQRGLESRRRDRDRARARSGQAGALGWEAGGPGGSESRDVRPRAGPRDRRCRPREGRDSGEGTGGRGLGLRGAGTPRSASNHESLSRLGPGRGPPPTRRLTSGCSRGSGSSSFSLVARLPAREEKTSCCGLTETWGPALPPLVLRKGPAGAFCPVLTAGRAPSRAGCAFSK